MLTQNDIKRLLDYNPTTGVFVWKPRDASQFASRTSRTAQQSCDAWNTRYAGKPAGLKSNWYIQIRIAGKPYYAHRLAWLYMSGGWPVSEIDHRDCDKTNNAWANLRAASKTQQQGNRRGARELPKGVHKRKGDTFSARLTVAGKHKYIGNFPTAEAAHAAYVAAAKVYFGEFHRP